MFIDLNITLKEHMVLKKICISCDINKSVDNTCEINMYVYIFINKGTFYKYLEKIHIKGMQHFAGKFNFTISQQQLNKCFQIHSYTVNNEINFCPF